MRPGTLGGGCAAGGGLERDEKGLALIRRPNLSAKHESEETSSVRTPGWLSAHGDLRLE
jgi:hypothetical protein